MGRLPCLEVSVGEQDVGQALSGPKLPVAGIAKARHDVRMLVEPVVERGQMDRYVWVFLSQTLNALGSGDQAEKLDACCTPLLEHLDRRGCRASGREHRVEEQAQIDVRLVRELVVVRDGLERLVVAVEA